MQAVSRPRKDGGNLEATPSAAQPGAACFVVVCRTLRPASGPANAASDPSPYTQVVNVVDASPQQQGGLAWPVLEQLGITAECCCFTTPPSSTAPSNRH